MALYFYFNETTGDLVYSDQAAYDVEGYASLGQQTNMNPNAESEWVFDSKRSLIVTVSKDESIVGKIVGLTNMNSMFSGCSGLTSIDLSGFDTSAVRTMSNMFFGCSGLTSLDLSYFNTSAVTSMSSMFGDCSRLTSLDLSGFDTSNVTSTNGMFVGCPALRIVDISPNMPKALSVLPSATYYDAVTRQPYAKADVPGGGTYVRDLADLDLVATMVQTRMGIDVAKRLAQRALKKIDDGVIPDMSDFVTKATADATYQPKGDYLTQTEGNAAYQPRGDYLTQTAADAAYQPKGDYLTEVPAEYLTQTEGDAAYAAKSHTHQTADVTGLQSALNGKAAKSHTHTVSQITDFPEIPEAYAMATDAEASGLLGY